jgi:uncharacterized protein (TIGR00369 family)
VDTIDSASQLEPWPGDRSAVTMAQQMLPADATPGGRVHGGALMKLADTVGAAAAMRHAGSPVVTAAVDSMHFEKPVAVGDIVEVSARVTWTGRTSLETRVILNARHPYRGEPRQVATAFYVFVAMDEQRRPCQVRPLAVQTDAEEGEWRAAQERRRRRLAAAAR